MTATELSFSPNRLYYGDCLDVLRGWPAARSPAASGDPGLVLKTMSLL